MGKIISIDKAAQIANRLYNESKNVVLAGGCFDILHIGHIEFLKASKKKGDVLFVILESDESIKKIKGSTRPINTQNDRAIILENLEMVDYVIKIPLIEKNSDYDDMVISLKPAIIATTQGDPGRIHKERQAQEIGGKVVDVTAPIKNNSTSRLVKVLKKSL